MGHEFIGVVEAVGADVRTVKAGDVVVAPFAYSDGTCVFCHEGLQTSCLHGGWWARDGVDGGQGEAVRVPQADGTLVVLPVGPGRRADAVAAHALGRDGTGHHAALAAKVGPGKTVAVVGDGAVGLCGVIAAKRLGAEQIIILGRHPDRIALAQEFGATDVVSERGDEAVERVRELTGGLRRPFRPRVRRPRPVDAHGDRHRPSGRRRRPRRRSPGRGDSRALPTFFGNVTIGGGPAPARAYIEELLPDVLEGRIEPGRVFDRVATLDEVPDGYRAMNEREAIKVLIEF